MVKGFFLYILYIRYVYILLLYFYVLKVFLVCKDNFCKDVVFFVVVRVFRIFDFGSMYYLVC